MLDFSTSVLIQAMLSQRAEPDLDGDPRHGDRPRYCGMGPWLKRSGWSSSPDIAVNSQASKVPTSACRFYSNVAVLRTRRLEVPMQFFRLIFGLVGAGRAASVADLRPYALLAVSRLFLQTFAVLYATCQ